MPLPLTPYPRNAKQTVMGVILLTILGRLVRRLLARLLLPFLQRDVLQEGYTVEYLSPADFGTKLFPKVCRTCLLRRA